MAEPFTFYPFQSLSHGVVQVEWGTDANSLEHVAFGERNSYVSDYPHAYYVSGIFHHTKLEGLAPETAYFYRQA